MAQGEGEDEGYLYPHPLSRNNAHPLKGEGTFIINKCSSQLDLCKESNESLIF